VQPNRYDRYVERRVGQLGRLAAVGRRPLGVRRQDGRGVDHYVSDWATQGLGMFVDDIAVSTGEGSTSFETDNGGWEVTQPADIAPNANNFERLAAGGFPEAAVVDTADTVYMRFGLEGITGSDARNTVLGKTMSYLLR
jgi:hypothetical protein